MHTSRTRVAPGEASGTTEAGGALAGLRGAEGGPAVALRWLLRTLVAGALYWTAAKLALLMAIPPGYATAVWPAAGLALVCVLVWGARVTPGIALGSCLVNIGTTFDGSSLASVLESAAVAAAIGCGAALQAAAGAALVRRFVGFPTPLESDRDIALLFVLGGPVSCLVSSSVAGLVLCSAGIVPWSEGLFSWWTWWVGDTIGVLLFAPLALLATPSPFRLWRTRRAIVGIPLVVGLAAVTLLFLRASAWEERRLSAEFDQRVEPVARELALQLTAYESTALSLASFFEASREVTRAEFRAYTARALHQHPEIQALGWNPHVLGSDRARFEEHARSEGLEGFRITELEAGRRRPASARSEYVPIHFLEPAERNAQALGYDVQSEPTRSEGLRRARASEDVAVTSRVRLVQGGDGFSVLVIAPVFTARGSSGGPRALRGYATEALRVGPVVDTCLRGVNRGGIDFKLVDEDAPADQALLFSSGGAERATGTAAPRIFTRTLELGGRRWRFEATATAAYMSAHRSWQAWIVLAAGLLLVGLIGIVSLMVTGRASQAQRLLDTVATMNRDLEQRVQDRTAEISTALREREVLIQEIHHRVKNNLQVISSLLDMQAGQIGPGAGRRALEECQTRVLAIALIHEQLYQARDYADVGFAEYAEQLVSRVFHVMGFSRGQVSVELAMDDIPLSLDRAIPVGLILNEVITNSLKHAFPNGRSGTIRCSLSRAGDGRVRLVVADDGVGFDSEGELRSGASLGMQIVYTLADQLGAELSMRGDGGASFEISFAADG